MSYDGSQFPLELSIVLGAVALAIVAAVFFGRRLVARSEMNRKIMYVELRPGGLHEKSENDSENLMSLQHGEGTSRVRLSDAEVIQRFQAALNVLGNEGGETTRGDRALKAARKRLVLKSAEPEPTKKKR